MARRTKRSRVRRQDDEATLTEHLSELRFRIIRSLLAVGIGMLVVLLQYERLLRFLTTPYRDLCAERPDFNCDLPVVMWQIWRFVVPALSSREKKYSVPFILSSVVLFAFGGALAYWTLDKALEFLISWSGEGVEQTYQISRYVSLVALMVLAFGVGFLLPVLIVFLQLVNVITPQALLKQWRVSFMVIFVLAAVITPSGDPISMLALALPMSVLFLIAVAIGFIAQRRRRNREVSISD